MVGMHVHHFPERCNGGRNVPEHLYVCSESVHHYGWHKAKVGVIPWASAAGKLGGAISGKSLSVEKRIENTRKMQSHPNTARTRKESGRKGGLVSGKYTENLSKHRSQNGTKTCLKRRKPVRCLETGEVFSSATEAARLLEGVSQSHISSCCRGKRKTSGGLHWEFAS
jgi:hypothetical protein